jgi:hypothetical protein
MMGFPAKYNGTCKVCKESIAVGQRIERWGQRGYQHVTCPTAEVVPESEVYESWRAAQQLGGDALALSDEIDSYMRYGH